MCCVHVHACMCMHACAADYVPLCVYGSSHLCCAHLVDITGIHFAGPACVCVFVCVRLIMFVCCLIKYVLGECGVQMLPR